MFNPKRFAWFALLGLVLLWPNVLLTQNRSYRSFPTTVQRPAAAQNPPFVTRTLPVYAPGINPNAPFYNQVNPFTYVAPGISSQQYLYNLNQQLRVASRYPPWLYGYNPYPAPIIVQRPVLPYPVSAPLFPRPV